MDLANGQPVSDGPSLRTDRQTDSRTDYVWSGTRITSRFRFSIGVTLSKRRKLNILTTVHRY
jgi:hypothetical protein